MAPKGSSKNLMQDAPKGGSSAAKQAAAIGSLIAVIGDEDTVTGMLLAGVGNVDARRTSNFMVVDSKTSAGQIEEAFLRFTKRSDVAVLLINQYIASQIRQTVDAFVRECFRTHAHPLADRRCVRSIAGDRSASSQPLDLPSRSRMPSSATAPATPPVPSPASPASS